jgi:hypothetical protein
MLQCAKQSTVGGYARANVNRLDRQQSLQSLRNSGKNALTENHCLTNILVRERRHNFFTGSICLLGTFMQKSCKMKRLCRRRTITTEQPAGTVEVLFHQAVAKAGDVLNHVPDPNPIVCQNRCDHTPQSSIYRIDTLQPPSNPLNQFSSSLGNRIALLRLTLRIVRLPVP